MKILFLHGLESGPHGTKFHALREMFGEVVSPDCTGVTDESSRLAIIEQVVDAAEAPFLVVGSSMGGLMALLLQRSRPEAVAGMVLCAPALHRPAAVGLSAVNLPPTVIVHGRRDVVVPIEGSRSFGVPLVEVEDDHRLNRSLPRLLREVFELKLSLLWNPSA